MHGSSAERQEDANSEGPHPRRVAMVAYSDVQLLDIVGPLDVLSAATELASAANPRQPGYAIEVVGPELTQIRATSGLRLAVDRTYADRPESLDTLMIAGGIGSRRAIHDPRVIDYVCAAAKTARRVCSICTGAQILAATGLLDGRRATTHWGFAATLAEQFPMVMVEPDAIFCRDGRFWTSAGVTAGMDLALALVEEDFGRDLALAVSRQLVLFMQRPGGQSQFSAQLAGQLAERDPLRDLQAWIVDHIGENLSVDCLAERVGMSPRHFARVFRAETGQSPGRYVECVRVEAARRLLQESAASVEDISSRVGLGSSETMRRAFIRQLGVGPAAYRDRFSPRRKTVDL